MSVAELSGIDRGKGGGSTVQGAAGSQEHGVQESWGTRSAIHGDILLCVQTEREIMTGDRREEGREKCTGSGSGGPHGTASRGPGLVGLLHRSGREAAGPERGADPDAWSPAGTLREGEGAQRIRSCPLQEGAELRTPLL